MLGQEEEPPNVSSQGLCLKVDALPEPQLLAGGRYSSMLGTAAWAHAAFASGRKGPASREVKGMSPASLGSQA